MNEKSTATTAPPAFATTNTKAPALPAGWCRYSWSDGVYLGGFLPRGPATTFIDVSGGQVEITSTAIKLTGGVENTGTIGADI